MNKNLLNKIFGLVFMILALAFTNSAYAVGPKIATFKSIDVPVTNQTFIFKEAYGSVEDDFNDVFTEVESYILQNGAKSYRKAILYLDYGVEKPNPDMINSTTRVEGSLMTYLENTYGKSTLKTYRRVLVGYLVAPQSFIAIKEPFKEYSLKNITVKAIQSMDKDVKTPLSVLVNPVEQDPAEAQQDTYSKADRLFDKISMLNYLSLRMTSSSNIGMMEMYDTKLNVFTFMVIPGNQEKFLQNAGLSPTIKIGEFKRRPDTTITEGQPKDESNFVNMSISKEPSAEVKQNNTTVTANQQNMTETTNNSN